MNPICLLKYTALEKIPFDLFQTRSLVSTRIFLCSVVRCQFCHGRRSSVLPGPISVEPEISEVDLKKLWPKMQ